MEPSDKHPSQDEFAKMVIDRLREAGVTDEISYDPEQFQVSVEGEKESVLFLHNAYREYCTLSAEHRPQSLRRFVRGWLQAHKPPPEEYADIRPDILPAVRSRSFFESTRLRMILGNNEDTLLPYQMLGDDLGLGLVYDMPDSMKPISNKELDLWGVTFYEALEAARENLAQLRPRIIGPKEGEGVYVFTTNDGYDSSRLILLELIRQFQVKGDYIAMAPGREMLIVAGSEDKSGLEAMLALAKKAFEQPRTVSGMAFRLDGDEWVSWMPKDSHSLYDGFRMLRIQSCGQDYAEQKELLDQLHKERGEDVLVASYSVMQHKDTGYRTSYCAWIRGLISLLPQAERIVFGSDNQEPVMAPWDKVVAIVGDLITPMGIYPERYRVQDFPSAEQLAAIGNELRGA
ncbi:MAG: DUF1444 family protein [Thermoguttaceae bacterium]